MDNENDIDQTKLRSAYRALAKEFAEMQARHDKMAAAYSDREDEVRQWREDYEAMESELNAEIDRLNDLLCNASLATLFDLRGQQ